ncbi:MAG: galactosyldiacylglycerol synthase [Deltaproteobacteria bacterium]|nr:galactosyldiacylglycerol synthase [Deltaproteobacteria bacterium]
MPIRLYIKDSGKPIGTLSDAQLQEMSELLEEEDAGDQDYYIDRNVLDYMEEEGADGELIALLRPLVAEDGIEVEWKEE